MRELPLETSRFVMSPADEPNRFELPSIDLWRLVVRRKWLIAGSLVLCVALAVLYLILATPTFESQVEILVTQKDAQFAATSYDVPDAPSKTDELLATHVKIFQSKRIIQEAVKKHRLDAIPAIREKIKPGTTVLDVILEDLEVRRGGDGSASDAHVVAAGFRSTSPEVAALVLDALVESYQNFLGETFEDVSSEAVSLIDQAKDDLLAQLKEQEQALRTFREESPLLWQNEQASNLHARRLDEVEAELALVRSRRAQVLSRLKIIEEALADGKDRDFSAIDKLALLSNEDVARLTLLIQATQDDHYASEQFLAEQPLRQEVAQAQSSRLLSLKQEEQRLLERYGSEHLNVREIRRQIEVGEQYLEKLLAPVQNPAASQERITLAELVETQIEILRHDARDLQEREKLLATYADHERTEAKRVATDELTAEMMQAEMQRTKDLYAAVLERLREISLVRDYGGYVTEVIAPIEVPEEPVAPMPAIVLLAGCLAGTMLGGALAVTAELTDRTFHSPLEVRQALALPIMGQIPLLKLPRRGLLPGLREESAGIDPSIVAHWQPRGREAETIRGLRTALHFSALAQGKRVIQVTSPNPQDGKSTLAANLAVAVASSGKRVLFIDADLRRPRSGRLLGITGEHGLGDVLAGEAGLAGTVQETEVPGLWVLPTGKPPANPAELLSRPEFDELVAAARDDYDLVLIDTPPLLAVSDPAITAPRVEGVLLVVRITKNGRPDVLRAHDTLRDLGANVIGVVLNQKDQDRSFGYGYGNGYDGSPYGRTSAYTAYLDEGAEADGKHHANGNGRPRTSDLEQPTT